MCGTVQTETPASSRFWIRASLRFTHLPSTSTGQAVLQDVVTQMGDIEAAALQLGISYEALTRYLNGSARVPDPVLLRAIDIVLAAREHYVFRQYTSA